MEVGGVIAEQDEALVSVYDCGDALGIDFRLLTDPVDYAGTDAIGKDTR
jgi:octaprenyl-diphosphate synthase